MQLGRKVLRFLQKKKPNTNTVAANDVNDKYSEYPSEGLTPIRLAAILKEADQGDVLRQMELFEEMEEKDPHLASQLQTRKLAVSGLEWEIQPYSEQEQDKEIALFVEQVLNDLENFDEIIVDILDSIGKGISFSELDWDYEKDHYTIKDIRWIHPKKFYWDSITDEIKVRTKESPEGTPLPENKFIVHKYKARSGHPSRQGILRVVAWMYLFKNYDVKDWVSFCEVFGMPLRLGKYEASASDADKNKLMEAIINLASDAAGIIPSNTSIEFIESNKTATVDIYEKLARYCDEQMSKAILGQTLTADSGGGSYAQGKVHNDVRHDLTVADARALKTTIRRDVIRPLVEFNFGTEASIPYIIFDVGDTDDSKELAGIYETLGKMGLKIPSSFLYQKFAIPKPEENEEILSMVHSSKEEQEEPFKQYSLKQAVEEEESRQQKVDHMIAVSSKLSEQILEEMIQPILKLVDNANSLEQIKQAFEDEKKVSQLYQAMNQTSLEDLLEQGMLLSHMLGRGQDGEAETKGMDG